jgi:hypothetical protein
MDNIETICRDFVAIDLMILGNLAQDYREMKISLRTVIALSKPYFQRYGKKNDYFDSFINEVVIGSRKLN